MELKRKSVKLTYGPRGGWAAEWSIRFSWGRPRGAYLVGYATRDEALAAADEFFVTTEAFLRAQRPWRED